MYSILPNDDPNQTLRMRRFFMAFSAYIMWMFLIIYCYIQGWFRMSLYGLIATSTAILALNLIIFLVFRTGLNKRFKDPSLTMYQMIQATFGAMIVAYFTDHVRGIVLLLYMVVFIFGVFRLQLRQFLILALYALTGYGYVIVLLLANHPDKINFQEAILYWIVLATVLSWFAAIGSYINHLREKLVKTNIELSQANERIRQAAIIDELTGAYNRRQMIKILEREKALADRGELSFSFCIFDLDDFKQVNDTFGHQIGDTVLRTLVQVIQKDVREQDYIARYGGEEFVVILAYPDMEEAIICAERIKNLASQTSFQGLPEDFRVTISMGLTRYAPPESIDTLIARADRALYRAKTNGKNRLVMEEPPCQELKRIEKNFA